MQSSLSHPAPSAQPDDDRQADPCDGRLRGLTREQLEERLRWLSWWAPGAFTAVMDYMEFVDAVAAGTAAPPPSD